MKPEMKYLLIRIVICLLFFLVAILVPSFPYVKLGLYLISYLVIGYDIVKEALEKIVHGEVMDEDFLMFIATVGAFITGEYPEAVMVMLLFQIGECLEDYAVDHSRDSIAKLMDIRPNFANIEKEGVLSKVSPEEVAVGDIIVVQPGEKVPLDGVVVEGTSSIDTSSLTGESALQKVTIGSTVLSGTINQSSMLQLKVTKTYENSTVSKILELVENASEKKAKTENFITKFAKYYTPIVVVCALMLAFLPPLLIPHASWMDYLHRACSFLVISCPCALVISVPLSFFAGLGAASKAGILIKGSNYLEALSQIQTMVLDKTGTLTKGSFAVTKVVAQNADKEELLRIAAYAENYSMHPIALSIKKAYGRPIPGDLVSNSTEIPGNGITVEVNGKKVAIGNQKLMEHMEIATDEVNEIGTILYVAIDNAYAGYLVIADEIKKEAKEALQGLHSHHINTVMLTGDCSEVANAVAKELKIENVYSNLLPNEKVKKLEEFLSQQSSHGTVAFVGDGINDAPVLTRADVGIAMGGLGSDAAIEAADMVIMDDSLAKIDTAIQIAQKTIRIVKENIFFAISIKLLVLLLSALGLATMWMAVFADVGVAFLAILNAMRTIKYKYSE